MNATRNMALGLGLMLAGGLLFWLSVSPSSGTPAAEANQPTGLAGVQMLVRGPEDLKVGQRCTIEVILYNTGRTPVKDLELQSKLDATFEHESKELQHKSSIATIDGEDVQIVRLSVTPRKSGSNGIDFTLRARDGATEQVRQVWPVLPETAVLSAPGTGTTPLKFKITSLRDLLVDRPGIVLIQVTNTDARAMPEKMNLLVSYASVRADAQVEIQPEARAIDEPAPFAPDGTQFVSLKIVAPQISTNPTRKAVVAPPALRAGENWTLPVRLTAHRTGDLGIAITPPKELQEAPVPIATARLKVQIDPRATAEQLLPAWTEGKQLVRLPKSLAEVAEISLEDPCDPAIKGEAAFERIGARIEKINHVNKTKTDAYMAALTQHRADLRGLPVTMGDACRMTPERGQQFAQGLDHVRNAMSSYNQFAANMAKPGEAHVLAYIAAMTQVLGPEGADLNEQAVKYLAEFKQAESTRALANLAVFSEDAPVRKGAIAALAGRPEKDITPALTRGLSYPWPAVAQRSAEAIVALKRHDLVDQLIETLDRADPRAPQAGDRESVTTVREMVRINHLRNCLLCHPPADPAKLTAAKLGELERGGKGGRGSATSSLMATVPLPGQSLLFGGYGRMSVPDVLVAFDVTYLRQDFSVMLPVADAQPWPESQRFDFVVRTREVSAQEAETLRGLLKPTAGEPSPYQAAALTALRQLTGKDAEPTAEAWRKALQK